MQREQCIEMEREKKSQNNWKKTFRIKKQRINKYALEVSYANSIQSVGLFNILNFNVNSILFG